MSLNWKIMDGQTMPTIIHVNCCTFFINKNFAGSLLLVNRCSFFSMTNFRDMYSCTSSKKSILKAFMVSQTRKKHVILYEAFKTIWTLVRTYQNGHASPLVLHLVPKIKLWNPVTTFVMDICKMFLWKALYPGDLSWMIGRLPLPRV